MRRLRGAVAAPRDESVWPDECRALLAELALADPGVARVAVVAVAVADTDGVDGQARLFGENVGGVAPGVLAVKKDFGAGYAYEAILENATLAAR